MSETYVFVSHTPVGLKAGAEERVLQVLPPTFSVGEKTSGWDFGAGAAAHEGSDRAVLGDRWAVTGPHHTSLAIGVVGPLRDVVVLTVSGLSSLGKALDDDGSSVLGLLSGLADVAKASRSLWLVDTAVADAVAAARGGDLDHDLLHRVRATWGDEGWADAVQGAGGTPDPIIHPHSAVRA
jgi:hypothetical protein